MRTVSGVMLALFLVGFLAFSFNVQAVDGQVPEFGLRTLLLALMARLLLELEQPFTLQGGQDFTVTPLQTTDLSSWLLLQSLMAMPSKLGRLWPGILAITFTPFLAPLLATAEDSSIDTAFRKTFGNV
jgi:hypothetical protein